jgi:hypothetical protein
MSRRSLTLSNGPIQAHNEGCLIKPRGLDRDMARPRAGDRDGASTGSRRDARNFLRDDYDEVRLNAADDRFAVEQLAGRMGKDAQKYGFGALPNDDSMAANLEHGWIGPLSVRPESSLIS